MSKSFFLAIGLIAFSAANASACFYSHETDSGMNKICYYDCVSGTRAITISITSLCPLSISYRPEEREQQETPILEANSYCLKPNENNFRQFCQNKKS